MNKVLAGIATAVLAATLGAPNSGAQRLAVEPNLSTEEKEQIAVALKRAGQKAARCPETIGIPFSGEGEVKAVLDGKKGRITDAILGAPFADSPLRSCIWRAFVGEIIPPFEGEAIQVPYRVVLPPSGSPAQNNRK